MSDMTADPTATAGPSERDTGRATTLLNAYNLARQMGRTGVADYARQRLDRVLGRTGLEESALSGEDFSKAGYDPNLAFATRSIFNQSRKAQGGRAMRPGAFTSQLDMLRASNTQRENTAQWESQGRPAFDQMQQELSDRLSSPTFSNDYIANARSQMAQQIKGATSDRLRGVSAVLGLRGMDPSSPAGAAIASRAALDADAALASSLADFGMKVEDIERQTTGREIALQSDLIARRMALEAGVKDPSFLIQLNSNLGGLMEALRAQKEAEELQRDLAREASSRDWLGTGMDLLGTFVGAAGNAGGFSKLMS